MSHINPKRSEIWQVDLNPTKGAEIQKVRPCLVVSSDGVGKLPIKLVGPITEWNDAFTNNIWHVEIKPDASNGLSKKSAFDALQLRGVDLSRFQAKIGIVSADIMEEVASAIAAVVEYQ